MVCNIIFSNISRPELEKAKCTYFIVNTCIVSSIHTLFHPLSSYLPTRLNIGSICMCIVYIMYLVGGL